MDHFDNCAMFEAAFGRALKRHEGRQGHIPRLPMAMCTGKTDGALPVEGDGLALMRAIAGRGGSMEIVYGRACDLGGLAYSNSKVSTLITRGFLTVAERCLTSKTVTISPQGHAALAMAGAA